MRDLKHLNKLFITIIICITVVLTILRIIFYFLSFDPPTENTFLYILLKNRDLNYKSLYNLMDNGIINLYQEHPLTQDKAIYLYFWFFIFYPFHIIPLEISIYIWDILRLISIIFIITNIRKITENDKDILYFYIFCGIGYFADMYLNNTNWLIQILLFESYIQLKKEKKLVSYILFTLAMYKIIIIVFPFILLVVKKIKIKEMVYYLLPLCIICIPYVIFPSYFMQMMSNWADSGNNVTSFILLNIFFMIWPLIQIPHLMFISIIALILLVNINSEKSKERLEILVYCFIIFFWVFVWSLLLLMVIFF